MARGNNFRGGGSAAAVACAAALMLLQSSLVESGCPNKCNGHGRCTAVNKCECYGAWAGGDCSQRRCPFGTAWADIASGTDVAHQPAECSNRGTCNTATGQCTCMAGYEGLACNRMMCPSDCGANGQCRSMRYHAVLYDKGLMPRSFYYSYASNWDADAIYGCSCDGGYAGYNCAERQCPVGDDPGTTGAGQVDEVQYIRCDMTPTGDLAWTLSFKGAVTAAFTGSTNAAALRTLLEALPTVGTVSVSYTAGTTFCNYDNGGTVPPSANAVAITFLSEHGPQPALVVLDERGSLLTGADDNAIDIESGGATITRSTGAGTTTTHTSVVGTKESAFCSNRGSCDRTTGVCTCYTGYGASNMMGAAGSVPDCGFTTGVITACPGQSGLIECSGHGSCVNAGSTAYTCSCNAGWTNGACSERTCPTGTAWFDYPSASNVAHASVECSAKGKCNRVTGLCECQTMFEGSACERMACPGRTGAGADCSGHGQCLPMSQLATKATLNGEATPYTYGADPAYAATWDGDKVYGCYCDAGWGGYDCAAAQCATGEDITAREWETALTDEVQTLTCITLGGMAGSPTFKLQFRDAETTALAYGATAAQVKAGLEALTTIGTVTVDMVIAGSTTTTNVACQNAPGTKMTVSFVTEHGDVPPVRVVMSGQAVTGHWAAGDGWTDTQLQWTGGDPTTTPSYSGSYTYLKGGSGYDAVGVRATEATKGTTSTAVCSGRGYCDALTGLCSCFRGFGSSDGARGKGSVSDCGYREPFWPVSLRGAGE